MPAYSAGIDYSLTCPAICVHPHRKIKSFSDCKVFFYKYKSRVNDNIFGMNQVPYECDEERYHNISEWAMAILDKYKVKDVCLEGYSMGSKGRVFNLAENGGLLKHKMWMANINVITPAPTTVKKFFSGKGNSGKELMYNAFTEKYGVDLISLLGKKKPDDSPISDIVDSVAMFEYLIDNQ